MRDVAINNGEIQFDINAGDFRVRESGNQEIEHILRSNKGVWRQSPLLGVGMFRFLNSSASNEQIRKEIKLALEFDDFFVEELTIDGGEINVIANKNEN